MKYLAAVFALTFVSCAKSRREEPKSATPALPVSLEGKSTDDILRTKYNKAVFTCSLWTQYGGELNTQDSPNDSFSVDLLKDQPSESQTLTGSVNGRSVEVTVTLNKFSIQSGTFTDENAAYRFEYSPVIELDLGYKSDSISNGSGGLIGAGLGHSLSVIHEKIRTSVVNDAIGFGGQPMFITHAECTVETNIKPEYANQFTQL